MTTLGKKLWYYRIGPLSPTEKRESPTTSAQTFCLQYQKNTSERGHFLHGKLP
ncbi:hypothetical protein GCM10011571_35320 [Marinithermofilum abyssi]|uniref:Uncharacterized protein n=1 Tax=Marinithermofilum abyssi TaxID=1571185 RepID=A0A8J2YC84_9BACL|nr:hypothetical protein GCM10011571_35320 [Marinithermofilum abyssi]